jgi:hypothetical protein
VCVAGRAPRGVTAGTGGFGHRFIRRDYRLSARPATHTPEIPMLPTCRVDSKTVRQNPTPNANSRNSTGSSDPGSTTMSARHEPQKSSRELGTLECFG